MDGHESEILTTTFLMLSAVSFGLILRWLKQPPLVGCILAGLALGPAGLDLVDLEYVKSHWGVIVGVTFGVLFIKTLLGWALLTIGGEPAGRALVSSLFTLQIGEFSFVLTTSGVASGIFTSFEADFLLAVIAASLFLSPLWSGMLHYLVIRYRIHDPVALPSNSAEPE